MDETYDHLLAIEKQFWSGDKNYYRQNADKTCLVAFAEMAGLMDNEDLAATARDGHRWRALEIDPKGLVRPTDEVAILPMKRLQSARTASRIMRW